MDENIHQICFNVLFELSEAYTTRIPQKTVQKPLKTTEKAVAGTNILPQNPKSVDISPPPFAEMSKIYRGACMGVSATHPQSMFMIKF